MWFYGNIRFVTCKIMFNVKGIIIIIIIKFLKSDDIDVDYRLILGHVHIYEEAHYHTKYALTMNLRFVHRIPL